MPKRSHTEDWIEAIRVFIRDTLGNKNWQIVKNKEKTMIGTFPISDKEPFMLGLSLSNSKVLLTTLLS